VSVRLVVSFIVGLLAMAMLSLLVWSTDSDRREMMRDIFCTVQDAVKGGRRALIRYIAGRRQLWRRTVDKVLMRQRTAAGARRNLK